jgi:hypothetical protein
MSQGYQGHLFRVKHPETGEWIDIPVLYQTMYQAYRKYCEDNGVTPLDEVKYYELMNNLNAYYDTLQANLATLKEYIETLESSQNSTLSLKRGGTGFSVENVAELLRNLGLTDNIAPDPNAPFAFPTRNVVGDAINALWGAVTNNNNYCVDTTNRIQNQLNNLGFTYGTEPPNDWTPGTIYIKYSAW